jgi:alpha-aminoadipate carrier protein LysW
LVRCPKCGVEVDVDEDEVEEGEILTCIECAAELEVVQIHPVNVNIISDDDDDEETEEDEDDEDAAVVDDALGDEEDLEE